MHTNYAGQQALSGAFGGSSSAEAFGSASAGPSPQAPQVFSRADTLELAAAYLGKSVVPYKILPQNENQLDDFPVNWTYGEHSIGGMLVVCRR